MTLDEKINAKKYLEDNIKNLSEPRIKSQISDIIKFLNIKTSLI